jgi:hypothetical protein
VSLNKVLAVLVTITWLAAMATLVTRHYGPYDTPAPGEAPGEWLFEERWSGIYHGGNKIGYAVSKLEKREAGFTATETSFMRVMAMGVEKDIRTAMEALIDEAFRLESFVFTLDSDVSMRSEGTLKNKEMLITLDMGGIKTEKKLYLPEAPYMSLSLTPLLKDPQPGAKLRFPMVEPSSLTGDAMELEVLAQETITVMGLKQNAYRLSASFKGAEFTLWVRETGEVLKQESMGLTFIKEDKEDATEIGSASIDLIADLAVPADIKLPPAGVKYLKVRLGGIDTGGLELHGGVQTFESENIVEIRVTDPIKKLSEKKSLDAPGEYLSETFLVQSADPSIISLADDITKGEKDTLRRAKLILDWVYGNIEKVPTMTIPSALEVLKSRRGDCNEHTTLYTALARAADVPTRIAVGVVHKDGYFYYHAWPEVFVGQWIPIDPTLGQFPADATHIRLLTGGLEKQLQLASVIGKLQITGIEYK